MPAYTIGHVISTVALISLIILMQFSFVYVVDNMRTEMIERELKEITDYVSNTLANLHFLVNSTNYGNVTLQKTLNLPSLVEDSTFFINITSSEGEGEAEYVYAYVKGAPRIDASSWILPGLKVWSQSQTIESGAKTVFAGCKRNDALNVYHVWIASE